jgi:hypothetical protein
MNQHVYLLRGHANCKHQGCQDKTFGVFTSQAELMIGINRCVMKNPDVSLYCDEFMPDRLYI